MRSAAFCLLVFPLMCTAQTPEPAPARAPVQSTSTGACSPIINSDKAQNLTFNCILGRQEYKATAAELEDRAARLAEVGYYQDAVATYDDIIKGLIVANKTPYAPNTRARLADLLTKEASVLWKDGKRDVAQLRLEHALKLEPEHRAALVLIQRLLRASNRNLEAAQYEAADLFRSAKKGAPLNDRRLTQILGDFLIEQSRAYRYQGYQLCEFYRLQHMDGLSDDVCFRDSPDGDVLGKALVEALVFFASYDGFWENRQDKAQVDAAFRRSADLASQQLAIQPSENWVAVAALSNRAAWLCRTKSSDLEKERATAYAAAEKVGFSPAVLRQFKTNLESRWTDRQKAEVIRVREGAWFERYAEQCTYVLPEALTSGTTQ